MTSVQEAMATARVLGVERLDAQLLLGHRLGVDRAWLLAHADATLTQAQAHAFGADLQRRADGVPLAYLVGSREFHGLRLAVTPDVLDPRPDTETLVDWALELLAAELASAERVVDLGTGSGAIALAVNDACKRVSMHATDNSPAALAVARANAERLGLQVTFACGDWWRALPGQQFDLALSNPPYVAADDEHLPALRHEPRCALTPGDDGMAAIETIVNSAPAHLTPGGWLLLEHGHDQAQGTRALLTARGFDGITTRADLARHSRCTGGRWRA